MRLVGVARGEQPHDLGLVEPLRRAVGAVDDRRGPACASAARQSGGAGSRGSIGVARRPVVVARQALGIAGAAHRAWRRAGVEPACPARGHTRDRSAGAATSSLPAAAVARRPARRSRPGRFRIHVVGRHRRDAAPVVDAGRRSAAGRRRAMRFGGAWMFIVRPEDQPRRGDGPEQVVEVRLRRAGQLGAGLGAEILDDHFLDVAMCARAGRGCASSASIRSAARLADADQDAGGERHAQLAGQPRCVSSRTAGCLSGEP